jgi:hypothetical protein
MMVMLAMHLTSAIKEDERFQRRNFYDFMNYKTRCFFSFVLSSKSLA